MKPLSFPLGWLLLVAGSALAASKPPALPLQPLIDATPPGGTLRLAPGDYAGPARIDRPLTLDGGGRATLLGKGDGTVLAVDGRDVTVRRMRIAGSGESHDRLDAGIVVEGERHRIEDNDIEDVLFGIHLRNAVQVRVAGNRVTGKDLAPAMRGDALRLWHSRHSRIEGNRFRRGRDLTFMHAPDNAVVGNHFDDGRYGMHIVFSPRLSVERNRLTNTGTGIVVLYSPGLMLRGNHIAHALSGGGAGIVFKESDEALVEGNEVLHCAAGLKVDAPPEPVGVLTVRNNRFAHNVVGLFFYGEAGGHVFSGNRFEHNLTPIAVSAPGVGRANQWRDNHWDDYAGFDRDGDGVGDTPHEAWLFADRLWMESPMVTFFRNSPALELLDFLERLAPFSSPHLLLRDAAPRMK